MYVDPTTRPTFNYDTPICFHINPKNVLARGHIFGKQCLETREPVLRATPRLFEPKKIETAKA